MMGSQGKDDSLAFREETSTKKEKMAGIMVGFIQHMGSSFTLHATISFVWPRGIVSPWTRCLISGNANNRIA